MHGLVQNGNIFFKENRECRTELFVLCFLLFLFGLFLLLLLLSLQLNEGRKIALNESIGIHVITKIHQKAHKPMHDPNKSHILQDIEGLVGVVVHATSKDVNSIIFSIVGEVLQVS